jgi:GGDEF domain-containing protein
MPTPGCKRNQIGLPNESDQIVADNEQTLSDADQIGADSEQTSADRDQIAADRDQDASDRDLMAGVDPQDHEITRDMRERTTQQREQTARARVDTAGRRDAIAHVRDLAAIARDQAAAARDLAMSQSDAVNGQTGRADFGVEIIMRAAAQRKRAAEHRVLAAEHRASAAEDRVAAAGDRAYAATERRTARADRENLAAQLAMVETDPLTGARTRASGLVELDREADRCRRTGGAFVVAYVDVVGLKQLNDTGGHSAGDELLRHVVAVFRAHLRSYDLIIRLGGDEFVCAIPDISEADVRQRFSAIAIALAGRPDGRGIRTGFATLRGDESPTQLIARATQN